MTDPSAPAPLPIRRALISVSDKTGLVPLAQRLTQRGIVLISTGGTAQFLRAAGLAVTDVSDITQFPEILDGRVKTLHPAIHAAILADLDRPAHGDALKTHRIDPIDLVVVNLYPFAATIAKHPPRDEAVEMIDIGGPAMIRAAAKNHARVTVVTAPAQYDRLVESLSATGGTDHALRASLAAAAFAHTARYDALVAQWLCQHPPASASAGDEAQLFPDTLILTGERQAVLRYGENPHQSACLYRETGATRPGVIDARQIQGKELSYNNINDTDAALDLVSEFSQPACVIVKHANPCGVALAESAADAFARALAADPVSAFGGIVALNRPLDEATARAIADIFFEVIIAPGLSDAAQAILSAKKNLRVLVMPQWPDPQRPDWQVKSITGGILVQRRDNRSPFSEDFQTVTRQVPTADQIADLRFAQTIVKHVKSNAIVLARRGVSTGIGAGQMSRVEAVRIALAKADDLARSAGEPHSRAQGAVAASDAFFPFADGVELLAAAGITAIAHPGGSIRDAEVRDAADRAGLAMVVTGTRHFRH